MKETVLEREHPRVSIHDSVEEMLERIRSDKLSNAFDRYDEQEKIRCKFCLDGLSCQLCSDGPCRISEKTGQTKGVCGIGPDAMAMRTLLLHNVMGAAAYSHHAYEAFRTLKATAEGNTPFVLRDTEKLRWICQMLGINLSQATGKLAARLADVLTAQMRIGVGEKNLMVDAFAPKKRIPVWQHAGLYPAGIEHEIQNCAASCLTNVDGSHVSLAVKALRLGLSTIYNAQIGLEMVQDILFGTPFPHEVNVDLGIMDPAYINIVFNGHQPWIAAATLLKAKMPQYQERAKTAGAAGLRVVGSIETGQELLQRFEVDNVFSGLIGDWLTIEPLLATGAVDVIAMEENCSPPAIDMYAEKYQFKPVAVSTLIDMPGLTEKMPYHPQDASLIAERLIDLAVTNFTLRKDTVDAKIPKIVGKAVAGFSTEAVLNILGNKLDTLAGVITEGKIKGIVALASCSTLRNGPQDYNTVTLTKELIRRDILVVSAGCGNHALEVAGLCHPNAVAMAGPGLGEICGALGIPPVLSFGTCTDTGRISMLVTALADHMNADIPDLPIAVTAPEWMEQKATIDGVFAIAYGAATHLSPVPFVTGAPQLVKLLTEEVENITGGKLLLGDDPFDAAETICSVIADKRKKLGFA